MTVGPRWVYSPSIVLQQREEEEDIWHPVPAAQLHKNGPNTHSLTDCPPALAYLHFHCQVSNQTATTLPPFTFAPLL